MLHNPFPAEWLLGPGRRWRGVPAPCPVCDAELHLYRIGFDGETPIYIATVDDLADPRPGGYCWAVWPEDVKRLVQGRAPVLHVVYAADPVTRAFGAALGENGAQALAPRCG